ncbi:MAG: hypothetical protein IK114_03755 [Fibrobacter sp.]|nr:hypothetical protein [Fibrobacter sp.]
MKKVLFLGALMALFLSCSDDTTYIEYDADPVMVESYKDLSDLDASGYSRGTRIFVRNEDCFYSWDGKSWNEIEEIRSSSSRSSSSSDDFDDESSDSDEDIESSDDDDYESSSSERNDVKPRSSSEEEVVEYSSSSAEESSSSERKSWRSMNKNYSYGEFVDERDGYLYRTIQIEDQLWFAENLNYDIPDLDGIDDECFRFDSTTCEEFGRYYTWYAMMDIQPEECSGEGGCPELFSYPYRGVCPVGWHLPDSIDVAKLIELFGGMEAAGPTLYALSFGFNFVGAGSQSLNSNGQVSYSNDYAGYPKGYLHFVSETEFVKASQNMVYFAQYYNKVFRLTSIGRKTAIPVRCIKDDPDEIARRQSMVGEE